MNYSKEEFTKKLIEFFERHDPLKVEVVDEVVEKFNDKQEEVFNHLTQLYAEKHGVDEVTVSNKSIFALPRSSNSGFAK